MIVRKNLKWQIILKNTWKLNLSMFLWSYSIVWAHDNLWMSWIKIPFAIIGALGTALALFLAFRNNSSYDRWWEARKIWGGVVNYSRTWGRQVLSFLSLIHGNHSLSPEELYAIKKELIYRHMAWMNALRIQLRKETDASDALKFLEGDEAEKLKKRKNMATQLVKRQGERLATLKENQLIDDFRHISMDNTLTELYNLQGMAERIKNTPLPRQYDYFPKVFLYIFVLLLPLGMISLFEGSMLTYYTVPLSMTIAFIFFALMKIGQYNEDPFENRITDTPMTALCRTIEIDLRDMLDEADLPEKIEPKDGFLF